jgi:hypothetical protein
VAFGSAGLLVAGGIVCAAAISGGVGQYLAFALIGIGLVAVVSLVFFEVGLSEDRELAREQRARRRRAVTSRSRRLRPVKLERSRGHRRRLP